MGVLSIATLDHRPVGFVAVIVIAIRPPPEPIATSAPAAVSSAMAASVCSR